VALDLYERKHLNLSKIKLSINQEEIIVRNQVHLYIWIKINHNLNELIKKEYQIITIRQNHKLIRMNRPIDNNVLNKKLVYNFSHRNLSKAEQDWLTNRRK